MSAAPMNIEATRPTSSAPGPPRLDVTEIVVGAAALLVGVTAWISLALANLDAWSPAAVGLGVAGAAVAVAVVLRRAGLPTLGLDRRTLVAVLALGALAAVMFLPGFPYAYGDKDPGVYVAHGFAIAREGGNTFPDPAAEMAEDAVEVELFSPGARFPGVWLDRDDPTIVNPQFYHYLPALFAVTSTVAGSTGVFGITPVLGVLSVLALALAVRRAFGLLPATLAGALLATNMIEVWQAKYPSTEMLTQLLLHGALLGVAVTATSGWRPAAGAAGILTGLTWLARPDGVLFVLLGVGGLAVLIALDRFDTRAAWYSVGLALTLPHALLQAYDLNVEYTRDNDVPSLRVVVALAAVALVGGLVARVLLRGPLREPIERVRGRVGDRRLLDGAVVVVGLVAAVALAAAWYRARLWGETTHVRPDGSVIRTFNEVSLRRLAWFLTLPGLAAAWAGLVVAGFRHRRAVAVAVLYPGLVLLPLYLYRARVASRLMWWVRRFVPVALPVLVVLIAIAIAWALMRRRHRLAVPLRVLGAGLAAYLLAHGLSQSWPLRTHHEYDGSYDVSRSIAAVAADEEALFLWQRPSDAFDPRRNLGAPTWLVHDGPSMFLPKEPAAGDLDAYRRAYPDRSLYLVTGPEPPAAYRPERLQLVESLDTTFPHWEESDVERPDDAEEVRVELRVWRVDTPAAASPARVDPARTPAAR